MCIRDRHAGGLLTERAVGHDGRAPYERLFGELCREDGYEFGELVRYMARPADSEPVSYTHLTLPTICSV
eukprot:2272430-Alexandrium_andersonii.AAC.1